MKIVILGAGQVGSTLAENLTNERNDVTVVDIDAAALNDLQERLDLRTVRGHASYPVVLREAGADDADMIIAVTDRSEEHTSELQSLMRTSYAVFCLKKKNT